MSAQFTSPSKSQPTTAAASDRPLGVALRQEFPCLVNRQVVYLDSGASTQKPQCVIDRESSFYSNSYANVHRGVYDLSQEATELFEGARLTVQAFLNARTEREVIFTRGATESVNVVSYSWGMTNLKQGDEILVTILEHHANIVPWQVLAERTGATVRFVHLGADENFSLENFDQALNERTKLVACTLLSNALGVKPPIATIVERAKKFGALVLLDAAQAATHQQIDVQALDCDFLILSAHKLYGPTGVGVLYGKEALLEAMPPFLSGGDMIRSVKVEGTTFNDLPYKFEAGTPNIAGVIAFATAIDFVLGLGFEAIGDHEERLVKVLETELQRIGGLRMLGPIGQHHALVSFMVEGIHPHDLAQFLNEKNIAVRAGHHCAQPLLRSFGVQATTRASLGVYNDVDDIEQLSAALEAAKKFFKV